MSLESRRGTRRGGRLEEREGRKGGREGEGGKEREGTEKRKGEWLLSENVIHLREHLYFKRP